METAYILQSGQKLNKSKFCKYLYRKFEKTSKNFNIKFKLKMENKAYCLDDAAIDVIYGLMTSKKARTKKSAFLFCLRKELEIYSRIKGIKFKFIEYKGLKLKIKEMLDLLEEKHKEIKYSILKAQLQALSL
jgi:hypothetical protein